MFLKSRLLAGRISDKITNKKREKGGERCKKLKISKGGI